MSLLFAQCQVLREMYDTGLAVGVDGSSYQVGSHIPAEDAAEIYRIVRECKPEHCVEIGMAFGASTLAILAGLRGTATLESVDPNQEDDWHSCGLVAVDKAGFSDRHYHNADPDYLALPDMLSELTRIDFAFIDGWHTFDHAFLDWWYIDQMLEVGGIVGFDDVHMPAVLKAIAFMKSHRKYERVHSDGSGRTAFFKKTSSERPSWDFYADF